MVLITDSELQSLSIKPSSVPVENYLKIEEEIFSESDVDFIHNEYEIGLIDDFSTSNSEESSEFEYDSDYFSDDESTEYDSELLRFHNLNFKSTLLFLISLREYVILNPCLNFKNDDPILNFEMHFLILN